MSKILIIDDDAAFTEGLAEAVTDFGYEALTASSGPTALKLVQTDGIALIFLDLRMPGPGGLEVLQELKDDAGHRDIPVVILTAFADSANTIEAMKLGAFDHLTKPVGREDIKDVLDRALARPRAMAKIPHAQVNDADELIGSCPGMREAQKRIGLAASSRDATVLILGETGRHRQGARGPGDSPAQPASHETICRGQLCGDTRRFAGK